MIGSTPWRRSQMSLAISTRPMPPATTDTRRASTLPTRRWPTRRGHVGELAARQQDDRAGDAAAAIRAAPRRAMISAAALSASMVNSLPASPPTALRDRRAIAGADERLEAGERRLGRVLARELDLLADLLADRSSASSSSASFMASER